MKLIPNGMARRAGEATEVAAATSALLRAAMDELPEGVVLLDPEGRYIHWNRSYAEIYERSSDLFEVGARIIDTLRVGVARGDYPEAIGREEEWIDERMRRLENPGVRHEQRLSNGRRIMIDERRLPNGCSIGLRIDVTELRESEASFRLLFESNPIPMLVFDELSRIIVDVNDAAISHYGYSHDRFTSMRYDDIVATANGADFNFGPNDGRKDGAVAHRLANGAEIEVTTYSRKFTFEGSVAILVAAIDTTERNRAEARIAFMARHDSLTSLPNRTYFRERLETLVRGIGQQAAGLAVILVDLDYFKQVNDTLGHTVGDLVLMAAADRLLEAVGPMDMVARLGGDEFAVLHPMYANSTETRALCDRILANFSRPFHVDVQTIVIGASLGVALAPQDARCSETLIRQADLALYASKNAGRGICSFFVPALDAAARERAHLESELRGAIASNELRVYYQPIVDLRTGQTNGMEALVRWLHPTRGLIAPGGFIPFAEQNGLISAIGEMVMYQACKDAAGWSNGVKVAINVSPIQFYQCDVLGLVEAALAQSGLPAARLEIEITETLLMEKSDATLATLNGLRRLGVGISLDDFGTGYSSLTYLRSFPFNKIKIDRSFVQAIGEHPASQAIVDAVVKLGVSLGMTVTAEGVEEIGELEYLVAAGCNEGQGFYFSEARPASEFKSLLGIEPRRSAA
jgi:diguanylate cyclase (GGDEF)-like protein/PAS domain S-box-containing protein